MPTLHLGTEPPKPAETNDNINNTNNSTLNTYSKSNNSVKEDLNVEELNNFSRLFPSENTGESETTFCVNCEDYARKIRFYI